MPVPSKNSGFTLLETIIYIGLFGLLFSGIFTSIYPILRSADRLTTHVLSMSEQEFMLAKINYILHNGVTSTTANIDEPLPNATSSKLIISNFGMNTYSLETGLLDCHIPMICLEKQMILKNQDGLELALNNDRIKISNLKVHRPPLQSGSGSNYLDISFEVNGEAIEPIRFYVHF